jgi:hypothetical protein
MADLDYDLDPYAATYHDRLDVSLDADLETIRSAGKFAYSKYHPDGSAANATLEEYHRLKDARDALEEDQEAYSTFITEVDDAERATQLYEKWVMKSRSSTPSVWLSKQDLSESPDGDSSDIPAPDPDFDTDPEPSDDDSSSDSEYNGRVFYKLNSDDASYVSGRLENPTLDGEKGSAEYDPDENTLTIEVGSEPPVTLDLDSGAIWSESADPTKLYKLDVGVERIRKCVTFSGWIAATVKLDGEPSSGSEDDSAEFDSDDTIGDWSGGDDRLDQWEDIEDDDTDDTDDSESGDNESPHYNHDDSGDDTSEHNESGSRSRWGRDIVNNDQLVSYKTDIESQALDQLHRNAMKVEVDEANFDTSDLSVSLGTQRDRIAIESFLDFTFHFDLTTGRVISFDIDTDREIAKLLNVEVTYDDGLDQLIVEKHRERMCLSIGNGKIEETADTSSDGFLSSGWDRLKSYATMSYRWVRYPFHVYSTKYPEWYHNSLSDYPRFRDLLFFGLWAGLMVSFGYSEPNRMLLAGLLIAPLPSLSLTFHFFSLFFFIGESLLGGYVVTSFLLTIVFVVIKYTIGWVVKPVASWVYDLVT